MRNLLSTSALIAPFLIGSALAQDPSATTAPADPLIEERSDEQTGEQLDSPLDEGDEAPDLEAEPESELETDAETDLETDLESETDPATGTDTDDPLDSDPLESDTLEADTLESDPAETTEPAETMEPATDPAADPLVDPEDDATQSGLGQADAATDEAIVREQAPNELRVDWITGTRVRSLDGENIGRITDLIFDEETNAITVAILSVGGFLGIGAKDIAVKFDELQIDFDAREIQLDLTRDAADAAPEYVFRERASRPAAEPMDAPATAPLGGAPATEPPAQPID